MIAAHSRLEGRARGVHPAAVGPADAGVVIAVGLVQVAAAYGAAHHGQVHHPWHLLAVFLLAAGPAALLVRRRHPVAVLAVAYAAALAYWLVGYGRGPLFPALVVAFISSVVAGHRRASLGCLAAGFVGFLWLGPLLGQGRWPSLGGVFALAAWLLVLFAAGEAIRARQVRAVERAQIREAESRRAVSEERLRIARELHDVLAHNISLINVQAGTALHRAGRNEEHAYDALAVIKRVSQDTLVELRSLLGALREIDEAAPRTPAPTMTRLDDLVASAAAAGVVARVETTGAPRALPPSIDLAAYRIMQEALTNVSRHAGTTTADVQVVYGDDHLVVQVDDHGTGTARAVAGTGITGMTERAEALGGRLEAGPRPAGGFRARLASAAGSGVIRVLLADDQALVRAGFSALLGDEPDIEVVGEAADGAQAIALARALKPDVVLMDIRMPGTDGLAATRAIAEDDRLDFVRVVILTTFELNEYIFEAIRAGASGFLVKDTEPAEMLRAVRVVANGDALLSPGVTRQLIAQFAARAEPPAVPTLAPLTDREREVTGFVGAGLSNDEIAARLYLSTATVKTHVNRAMSKLGARDRAQLVVFAYESGLVRPGWAN